MTKTQHRHSKISAELPSFILASNSPTTARRLGLEANPAAAESASNITLMSDLCCPSGPWPELTEQKAEGSPVLCVWSVSVCLLLPGSLEVVAEAEQGWQDQHQKNQQEQQTGTAKATACGSECAGGRKRFVPPGTTSKGHCG